MKNFFLTTILFLLACLLAGDLFAQAPKHVCNQNLRPSGMSYDHITQILTFDLLGCSGDEGNYVIRVNHAPVEIGFGRAQDRISIEVNLMERRNDDCSYFLQCSANGSNGATTSDGCVVVIDGCGE